MVSKPLPLSSVVLGAFVAEVIDVVVEVVVTTGIVEVVLEAILDETLVVDPIVVSIPLPLSSVVVNTLVDAEVEGAGVGEVADEIELVGVVDD